MLPGVEALQFHDRAQQRYYAGDFTEARRITIEARRATGIEIDPGAQIGDFVFIDHGFGTVIGETAIIGNYVTIYQGVTLGSLELNQEAKRHPTVKDHALIGAGAKVMGTITVGHHAKVGTNAVVLQDVPDCATAVGVPARIILNDKKIECFSDLIEE